MNSIPPQFKKLKNFANQVEISKNGRTIIFHIGKGGDELEKSINFIVKKNSVNHEIEFRIVLWDQARINIKPILRIEKGAYDTDTYLKITCLLMSEQASAEVTPGLEILEDKVESGHGAVISTIDQNQLDYLMSRGLSEKQAQNIIIQGFLNLSDKM